MTKDALLAAVKEKTGAPKTELETLWAAFQETIAEELRAGGEFTIAGVGKLKAITRAARTGRNPQTGEAIEIPAKRSIKLVVSSKF
ncbi:HU family DNA-binding protein [Sulfoacidibacillus thermotolerans]|uniref:DNA-binding protein n=1 Tax=Sulfoacidibacillus thermotolerans TaxID=1765684 RepID=A0A2U3D0X4_SULT2|nr:HU family DNA-binding protein [Sulfoacidibacillus thermotolerans]PWI54885.1 hypothetical protein BM613_13505 [Sulfoacidibacillus thermotolerans]